MIPTCEVVFDKKDRYKEKFSKEMEQLFDSIKDNLWEQRIYTDLLDLLVRVAQSMPKFSIVPSEPIHGMQTITNESYVQLCSLSRKSYVRDEDYDSAVGYLLNLVTLSEEIPLFDRLILDYLKGVANKYSALLDSYKTQIDREVDENADQIFQGNHYKTWLAAKNGTQIFEKLRDIGRKSNIISKKKNLWLSLIKQNPEQMAFTLYSGKK